MIPTGKYLRKTFVLKYLVDNQQNLIIFGAKKNSVNRNLEIKLLHLQFMRKLAVLTALKVLKIFWGYKIIECTPYHES